ncbi:MAG: DUF1800 domain-containing protein [Bacteroidetes bacterium]|nr:DUF1800 domain-containing protein [Bacteroidota bacterium]
MSALTRATLYIAVLFLPGLAKAPVVYAQGAEATDRDRAVHLLQRATYGPRPQDIEQVLTVGIADWLDWQLHPERITDAALAPLLDRIPVVSMSLPELLGQYPPSQVLRSVRELAQGTSLSESERRTLRRELGEHSPRRILDGLATARITRAVHSERQLQEMMTTFWFDHFNVFWGKDATRSLVPDYERSAIRPHVFGKFEDMVLATAQHPAMLFYLDNFRSTAPDSSLQARERREANNRRMRRMPAQDRARSLQRIQQQQNGRRAGLNENYARELMELHTLGVDGGYSQADVIDVARILTGWTFGEQGSRMRMRQAQASYEDGRLVLPEIDYDEAYQFRFRAEVHDAGEKTVMGHVFEAGGGQEEGVELIRMLAHHPSTARHVATQLATRFVADDPSTALVDHLAEVFLATSGDLREVTRALFTSAELDKMETPETTLAAVAGLQAGYGYANYWSHLDKKAPFHGHDGGIDGFVSKYAYNRQLGVGYALSNNGSTGFGEKIPSWIVDYLTQSAQDPTLPVKSIQEKAVSPYTGYYRYYSSRNELFAPLEFLMNGRHLRYENDTLYLSRFLGKDEAWVHSGNNLFRKPDHNTPTMALLKDSVGKEIIAGMRTGYLQRSGFVWPVILRIILVAALLFNIIMIPAGVVISILQVFGKVDRFISRSFTIPFLSSACFVAFLVFFMKSLNELARLGSINFYTAGVYISGLLFAAFTLISLIRTIGKIRAKRSKKLTYIILFFSVLQCCLLGFMVWGHYIGLKTWVY